MKKRITSIIVLLTLMIPYAGIAAAQSKTVVRLDPSESSPFNNGEFQGWGTSLCWWANRMGYSERLTEQAAQAFFSEEGLGLDIARYNLGGGDDPSHNHVTRSDSKIPSFALGFDGEGEIIYDWTADKNQLNIAKAAMAANPDIYFEGFSNSPPWFMTNSLCSSGAENAGDDNLSPERCDDFGNFIAEVTEHFRDEFNISFKSYSPMNEPDTTYWGALSPKQEGAHYTPGETQSNTIIAVRKALDAKGLNDVIVAGMDETDIDKSVRNYSLLSGEAKTALGRIDTHTYGGSQRKQLKETAQTAGKNLWMSEVDGGWDGFGLASRIILDMNGMQPSAWVMWDIVDKHKDSSFTTPDGTKTEAENTLFPKDALWGVGMADHDTETLELANKYYFFGQFTRYINPGDTIIASSGSTLAAYNKNSGDIKIVAVNAGSSDREYDFDISAFVNAGSRVTEIRTNNETGQAAEHWKEITGEVVLKDKILSSVLKAETVTTYIIHGSEDDGLQFDPMTGKYSVNRAAENKFVVLYDDKGVLKAVRRNSREGRFEDSGKGHTAKLFTQNDISYMVIKGSEVVLAGEETYYTAELGPSQIRHDTEWRVSDENIASVTPDGRLMAKARGDVTLEAVCEKLGISSTLKIHVTDDSEKYDGGSYSFVKNVPEATNDFTKGLNGFVLSGGAALCKDGEGANVLGVQPVYNNKDGAGERGSVEIAFKNGIECKDNEVINIAFDIYCSNSGGIADFELCGEKDTELVKMHVLDWDNYEMTVGGTFTPEPGGAKTYLRNYVNDKAENQLISNGGHMEIYYKPSDGSLRVTLNNNTNDEEMKIYEGSVRKGIAVTGLVFSADYTTWSKPMYVDNLVTNILEE